MREFASEPLVRRLIDWGIDTVFGRPGDGPEGVVRAFQRHEDQIRLLTVAHEEAAGLMACGYAKATGRIGVCLATSGPGAIHLLNGLYDAKLDHQPVLAITENPRTRLLGTGFDQEVCLDKVLADVADYNARVHVPVQIPAMVDIGIGNAVARSSVSHIAFPWSLEPGAAESGPWMTTAASAPPTAPVFVAAPGIPPAADLERAAAVLNEGSRAAMLVGVGGTGATNELLAVAEVLGSPIVKSLPGKAVVPDDHPLTTGCAGVLGTRPSQEALRSADTLLVVGSNYPYLREAADPEAVGVVHLDTDMARIHSRRPDDVPLVGDAAETLQALLPLLRRRQDRGFLELAVHGMAAWRERLLELEDSTGDPVRPGFLVRTIDRLAAGDAVLCPDPGAMTTWSARHFEVRGGRGYLVSASLAALPSGLPYAIAAQASRPGRQCIALVGSDGFTRLMAELLTMAEQHLPVKVLLADTSMAANFALWADASGVLGLRVEAAGQLEGTVARALDHDGPVLVDVLVDPSERPAPALGAGA
ncbi:MAG TPA: thiamine pyrophosphate-binding protein [Actinomycetota bacterium]|nr:thiamine pyrophosphate-binding protein [Actinomycetota bacterium]